MWWFAEQMNNVVLCRGDEEGRRANIVSWMKKICHQAMFPRDDHSDTLKETWKKPHKPHDCKTSCGS
jgi:hypothetical protein